MTAAEPSIAEEKCQFRYRYPNNVTSVAPAPNDLPCFWSKESHPEKSGHEWKS